MDTIKRIHKYFNVEEEPVSTILDTIGDNIKYLDFEMYTESVDVSVHLNNCMVSLYEIEGYSINRCTHFDEGYSMIDYHNEDHSIEITIWYDYKINKEDI